MADQQNDKPGLLKRAWRGIRKIRLTYVPAGTSANRLAGFPPQSSGSQQDRATS